MEHLPFIGFSYGRALTLPLTYNPSPHPGLSLRLRKTLVKPKASVFPLNLASANSNKRGDATLVKS
jgi:hypothetical protein